MKYLFPVHFLAVVLRRFGLETWRDDAKQQENIFNKMKKALPQSQTMIGRSFLEDDSMELFLYAANIDAIGSLGLTYLGCWIPPIEVDVARNATLWIVTNRAAPIEAVVTHIP